MGHPEIPSAGFYPASPYGRVAGQTQNMTLYDVLAFGYDLGLTDWPMWEPKTYPVGYTSGDKAECWRTFINDMLIDHFLFREIGCETVTQFIFYLNRKMRENMPAIGPVFSALEGMDGEGIRRSNKFEESGVSVSTGNGTSETHAYASTNPRQTMVGKDPTEYFDSGTYTTGKTTSDSDSDTQGQGQAWAGYPTDATNRWWAGVNNALVLVFDACEPCFSHIWKDHFNAF